MRGDRHMGTARSHNKTRSKPNRMNQLTRQQRVALIHNIGNRGMPDVTAPDAESQAQATTEPSTGAERPNQQG